MFICFLTFLWQIIRPAERGLFQQFQSCFYYQPIVNLKVFNAECPGRNKLKYIGLSINGSYKASAETVGSFTKQHTDYAIVPALKIFPFSAVFNEFHRSLFRRNTGMACYSFEAPKEYPNWPNGPYLSVGYSFATMRYNYMPDTTLHSAAGGQPFTVKNNGVQLEAGYQVTAKWLSVAIGYHVLMSTPRVEGRFNPFGNALYTNTYPFNYRIQQGFVLQIGFNLSL